ncbi:unnamed protein product [Allacma fusca]|uniref:39S ribosomal protein L41, mitochondrial n=1 Tax=Allacma fusca TaxID=39272 RepID=A0A8J2LL90_9HEXA|nr:unnamed protein product [Allacma fusca]
MSLAICLNKCFDKLLVVQPSLDIRRSICLSSATCGKRNFRKFSLGNKRGTRDFKLRRAAGQFPDMPVHTDVKPVGYFYGKKFVVVPEMIPELVVPDLKDFKLKPYVSYRTPAIAEDPFTPQALFDAVYMPKIIDDYKKGKILEDGSSEVGDLLEKLTPEEAIKKARMTGSDIRSERVPKHWECLDIKLE